MSTITITTRVWAALFVLSGFLYLDVQEATRSQTPPQTSTPEGLQLLHKMQAALGGAEKIASINDYEETVRAETWNSSGTPIGEVRKRTRWMRSPNLLRLDQIGPRDTYVLYFDGDVGSGWEILPDLRNPEQFKTTGTVIELAGDELRFAKSYLSGFQFNSWLADRIPGNRITSPASNVLRIEHGGNAEDITLDAATGLPTKSADISLSDPTRPARNWMLFEEWAEVGGVRFPIKRDNYHNGARLARLTTEENIRINSGLKPQILATKPANFAPEIPHR